MRLADFDYDLPPELIATHPTKERRASRLLTLDAQDGSIADRMFSGFPSLLQPNDLLVFNDTRVIRARLHGRKQTGGKVEILIERIVSGSQALAHIKASKSPRVDTLIELPQGVTATVTDRKQDLYSLQFSEMVGPFLERHGEVPLPPYLGRDSESADDERYQTVYAKHDGAVAAPTAGLHFDTEMMQTMRSNRVRHCFVTLHVGAGTFQSLRHDELAANKLHEERVRVDDSVCSAIADTRASGGRVIAIGTTAVRALETAAADGAIKPYDDETGLFILPGYRFRVVDAMLTNFHLPQSSLLMLVSAFAGRSCMLDAYQHAIREKYRFFSYGDAMFVTPASSGQEINR
jgi:S-adenosylmethionine:tRNA ribosyltransferase-isomerase